MKKIISILLSIILVLGFASINVQAETNQNLNNQIIMQINKYRKSKDLSKVKSKKDLKAMAKVRAKEISKSFSHTRPNGKTLTYLAESKDANEYKIFGENLARIKGCSDFKNIAKLIVKAWKNSKAHRKVMSRKGYKYIGCAYYLKNNTIYICTIYAY